MKKEMNKGLTIVQKWRAAAAIMYILIGIWFLEKDLKKMNRKLESLVSQLFRQLPKFPERTIT